jgi:hypothetical protein
MRLIKLEEQSTGSSSSDHSATDGAIDGAKLSHTSNTHRSPRKRKVVENGSACRISMPPGGLFGDLASESSLLSATQQSTDSNTTLMIDTCTYQSFSNNASSAGTKLDLLTALVDTIDDIAPSSCSASSPLKKRPRVGPSGGMLLLPTPIPSTSGSTVSVVSNSNARAKARRLQAKELRENQECATIIDLLRSVPVSSGIFDSDTSPPLNKQCKGFDGKDKEFYNNRGAADEWHEQRLKPFPQKRRSTAKIVKEEPASPTAIVRTASQEALLAALVSTPLSSSGAGGSDDLNNRCSALFSAAQQHTNHPLLMGHLRMESNSAPHPSWIVHNAAGDSSNALPSTKKKAPRDLQRVEDAEGELSPILSSSNDADFNGRSLYAASVFSRNALKQLLSPVNELNESLNMEADDEQDPCARLVQSPVSAPVSLPTVTAGEGITYFDIQIGGGPTRPLSALQELEELDYGSTSTETDDEEGEGNTLSSTTVTATVAPTQLFRSPSSGMLRTALSHASPHSSTEMFSRTELLLLAMNKPAVMSTASLA